MTYDKIRPFIYLGFAAYFTLRAITNDGPVEETIMMAAAASTLSVITLVFFTVWSEK